MQHFSTPIFWTACAVIISMCSLAYAIRRDVKREGAQGMKGKVNITDCKHEMKFVCDNLTRLSNRVSVNEKSLERGNKRFTKTEKCLIALVEHHIGKGEAAKMGLYE